MMIFGLVKSSEIHLQVNIDIIGWKIATINNLLLWSSSLLNFRDIFFNHIVEWHYLDGLRLILSIGFHYFFWFGWSTSNFISIMLNFSKGLRLILWIGISLVWYIFGMFKKVKERHDWWSYNNSSITLNWFKKNSL